MNEYEDLSKEVSYALRHAPWEYELEMDKEGWSFCFGCTWEILCKNNCVAVSCQHDQRGFDARGAVMTHD